MCQFCAGISQKSSFDWGEIRKFSKKSKIDTKYFGESAISLQSNTGFDRKKLFEDNWRDIFASDQIH